MSKDSNTDTDFRGFGIADPLFERITELGFVKPTPIQSKAIPIVNGGEDVVGVAQTGSGKTLAFSIPMIQFVAQQKKMGLVVLPTRELAVQVEEVMKEVAGKFGLRTALLIGGTNPHPQRKDLKKGPHIIVATPGRLIDHVDQRNIDLKKVGMIVLDEADRMLDMGFIPQIRKIFSFVPKERQTMLFSATMPERVVKIATDYMRNPLRIEVAPPGTTAEKIDQEVFIVKRDEKMSLLDRLLKEYEGSTLIFTRTKHGAKNTAERLRKMGYTADELHSNRSQAQRQRALKGFANGKYRIMVATDIAARGIDVDHLALVVNYDLPEQVDDYTHRIGRTGRAGREGKAISFAMPSQKKEIVQIQQLINKELPIKGACGKDLGAARDLPSVRGEGGGKPRRFRGGGGRGGGRGRRR